MTESLVLPGADSPFATRPWRGLVAPGLDQAAAVPTMLSREEQRLYYWLARDWACGAGAIVDVGCFIGGSTARLAAGQAAAGRTAPVHAYDQFRASSELKERLLYPRDIDPFEGEDILMHAHRLLAPWKPAVRLHPGDILEQSWSGDPIELLVVDAAKSTDLADHIAQTFFPALIPGRSLLVHQDFLHRVQPWLPAQMLALAPFFTPLARVATDCMVFLCTARPTPRALEQARTAALSDHDLTRAIRRAAQTYASFASRYPFARMVRKLAANPGTRVSWKMWRN